MIIPDSDIGMYYNQFYIKYVLVLIMHNVYITAICSVSNYWSFDDILLAYLNQSLNKNQLS